MKEIEGNLFDYIDGPCVIAHGCNAQGVMGAGFAKTIASRYPSEVLRPYINYCDEPVLGGVFMTKVHDELFVANMITQNFYGKWGGARLAWIESAIREVESTYKDGFRYLAPRIGCGLGGLSWRDVRPLFENSSINWEIYYL